MVQRRSFRAGELGFVARLFGDDLYLPPGLQIILAFDDDLFAALQAPVEQSGIAERLLDGDRLSSPRCYLAGPTIRSRPSDHAGSR